MCVCVCHFDIDITQSLEEEAGKSVVTVVVAVIVVKYLLVCWFQGLLSPHASSPHTSSLSYIYVLAETVHDQTTITVVMLTIMHMLTAMHKLFAMDMLTAMHMLSDMYVITIRQLLSIMRHFPY